MRRFARLVANVLLCGLLLWLVSILCVLAAGAKPSARAADAIIVLGAAQYNGRPSPVLRARLDHALALYDSGMASHMIFTGGQGAGDTISEAEVSRTYAVEHGVPVNAIMIEREGETSAQSVRAAAALMNAASLESALFVSDSYHMMRLELLARRSHIVPYRAPAVDSPIRDASRRTRWEYVFRESLLFPATVVLGGR